DAGDADPASRRRRSGHGADRGRAGPKLGVQDRSLLDCRCARRGIRFFVADRSSIKHSCYGTWRIPLRGLLEIGTAAFADRCRDRRSFDRSILAAALKNRNLPDFIALTDMEQATICTS